MHPALRRETSGRKLFPTCQRITRPRQPISIYPHEISFISWGTGVRWLRASLACKYEILGKSSTLSKPHLLKKHNNGASSQGWVMIKRDYSHNASAGILAPSKLWLYLLSLPCQPHPGFLQSRAPQRVNPGASASVSPEHVRNANPPPHLRPAQSECQPERGPQICADSSRGDLHAWSV